MPSWWIGEFVRQIGADRVAMGSDWPWHHLEGVVKNHELAIPNPEDRAWTMCKTAARVYGIKVS
jgi:predicted TIM-barrel fold metal-dependent hydrolase